MINKIELLSEGTELICIKEYNSELFKFVYFHKNKTYKIKEIVLEQFVKLKYDVMTISNYDGNNYDPHISIDKETLLEHFITLAEYRNLKINEIINEEK